ncbi:MAG: sigma-54 interaction domain-containing protein, partial [Planctomycetota bacterium]
VQRLVKPRAVLVSELGDGEDLLERLGRENCDLIVMGRSLLPTRSAERIAAIRASPDRPEVVVVRDVEDAKERARLLAAGCLSVLHEGLPDRVLRETLAALVDRRREEAVNRLRAERPGEQFRLADFASRSPKMRRLMATARRLVSTDSSLLILGETGVGKEWLARAVHAEGPRASGPFMAVNCAALPETLLESELFGHERGSFTGAVRARRGYFELAHKGTIFLDEVGEIPAHLQVKLLRVLQERKIQPVGSERPIAVDVRVIAATNRDLEADMESGRFRPDLYYRLGVVTLTVPPLRERREDIPSLVESYLDQYRTRFGRQVARVGTAAMDALTRYAWPGNVRELINVIERAVLLCAGDEIGVADLPDNLVATRPADPPAPPGTPPPPPLPRSLLERPLRAAREQVVGSFEREYLAGVLRESGGRVGEAAARAGINPRSLFDKMRQHGLRKEDFKVRGCARPA